MNLSKNFTLEEMTASKTAARRHIDNTPNATEKEHLRILCSELLQPLRDAIGSPIIVTSGFRCRALNKAVGGAPLSYHCMGMAADLHLPNSNMATVYAKILLKQEKTDLVIHEIQGKTEWLHIQYSNAPRHRFLKIIK